MPDSGATLRRATAAAVWLLPAVFLLWLYREAFSTWFMADDFAWLSLLHSLRERHDLLDELFAPMAQGTIRPWSERAYFIGLQALFGLDSLPFHIITFVTAAADIQLITWVTRRLTGSRLAGFLAPTFWVANTALVRPMTWNSAYNEVMCPLFLLGALALFVRYIETGRLVYWWAQLAVFVLGFGALEINIVYPAIAAAWVVLVSKADRRFLRSVLPLAAISVAYFALHRYLAPQPTSGPYALHFDSSILKTLALYAKWTFSPEPMKRSGFGHYEELALLAIVGIGFLAVLRGSPRKLFGLAWFALTLAPLIPLADHRSDYYLTIPTIGIAMFGAAAVAEAWKGQLRQRVLTAIPVAAYFLSTVPVTAAQAQFWRQKSDSVRTLVLGVQSARQTHPGKPIALQGVTDSLFELSFAHDIFARLGVPDVYLTDNAGITGTNGNPENFVLEPEALAHAVTHDEVVVYSIESNHLRNITEGLKRQQESRPVDRLPSRVDVGNSLYSWLLGPAWLPVESGVRWMPGRATLRIGVPAVAGRLALEGRCPSVHLSTVPRHLMVLVDGVLASHTRIYDSERIFHRLIQLPADMLAGKKTVDVEIRVDPVDRIDGQDYGLVFGKVAILP